MAKKILIETSPQEVRIAILKEDKLEEFFLDTPFSRSLVGNVYKGRVVNIDPTLQAAFVEFGEGKNGFLPLEEIDPSYFLTKPRSRRKRIESLLQRGQPLIVQVTKDPRGEKGAYLTTYLALAGRYLVLMPNKPVKGVSLKIEQPERRRAFKEFLSQLELPEGMGLIVRTAASGRSKRELFRDLEHLFRVWESIKKKAAEEGIPSLLYEEPPMALKVIRDYFTWEVKEILVDDEGIYQKILSFFQEFMPRYRSRVRLYKDPLPLFERFHVEEQVKGLYQREFILPSGGSLYFDLTEALVAIDVNTSKGKGPWDPESLAFLTNLEAASEIPRQLRLRGLSGLVVVDFIDMADTAHKKEVERTLREGFKTDKAKVEVGSISKFGLLELSRQRLRPSLLEVATEACPHCGGKGWIRKTPLLGEEILRELRKFALRGEGQVKLRARPEIIEYLQKYKLEELERLKVKILFYPDSGVPFDLYEISPIKGEER
jgi:ribonuclease E